MKAKGLTLSPLKATYIGMFLLKETVVNIIMMHQELQFYSLKIKISPIVIKEITSI